MRLISNKKIETHLTAISKLLDNAEEVIFCVAFLKKSGLDSIIENLKNSVTKCKFYIGTDFYLTEPIALRTLFKNGHEVYITKKERITYHPKIFYFRKGNSIDILVGSTNLTSGGLETNIEASIALTTSPNSVIDNEFKNLLASLTEHSTLVNEQIISNYEMKFLAYRKRHNKADQEFQIDLLKIDELIKEQEIELAKLELAKQKNSGTGNPSPRQSIVKIRTEDYDEFPVSLAKYIDYRTNIRSAAAVYKKHTDKDLVKWYDRMKELIRNEALPDELALQLIDADFPFENAWGSTIRMMWDQKFRLLLEFKEKEQKHLDYTYVTQTSNKKSPYYELGYWIGEQKQRIKGQHGSPWGKYEEQKMQSINYMWDRPDVGGESDDEGWWGDLMQLQKYYSDKKNYHSVPSQKTKLGRWLNEQMTLKNTGTRRKGREKKFLNGLREDQLGELLKKNNVEWKWQEQLEREGILAGLKGWRELTEWEAEIGNRRPTSAEKNYFKPIRDWKAGIRNRSKTWDREKEKWKLDILTDAGFPLPEPNLIDNEINAST